MNPERPLSREAQTGENRNGAAGRFSTSTGLVVSILLAAAVVAVAATRQDRIIAALRNVDPAWLVAGAAAHLCNYLFRSMRIRLLHPGELPLWPTAFRAMSIHGFFTYLLPLRSGDLTLPALLKTSTGVDWRDGFRMLVSVRLLDVCALGLWVTLAALVLPVGVEPSFRMLWLASGVAMASLPLWVRPLARLPEIRPRFLTRLFRALGATGRVRPREIMLSLLIWTAVGGCQFCVAHAVGIDLTPGEAWFLVTVQLPLQLLPVQGLANAGNHEAGWVAALVLLGISADSALSFALSSHVILLAYVCVLGLAGVVAGGFKVSDKAP